jgi:hypothetical protein
MSYNATAGRWEYQTVSADLPSYATYRWDAYSYDGTVYSGGATAEANATPSTEAVFVYAQGPTVTITSPANNDTVTTITPTITWTVSGGTQQQRRVRIWNSGGYAAGAAPVFDTGWVTTSSTSLAVTSGYLKNGQAYDLVVNVKDTLNLEGQSSLVAFTVQLTPPAQLTGVVATPVQLGTDPWPTAIRVSWDPTTEPEATWVQYLLYRDDLSRPLAVIQDPAETSYLDPLPVSGQTYRYTVTQVALRSGVQVESNPSVVETVVNLRGVVLVSVVEPQTRRAVLTRVAERKHATQGEEAVYRRWGDRAPVAIRTEATYWETTGRYVIADDEAATAADRRAELEALWAVGGIFCYRDERGMRRFVTIPVDGLKITDQRLGRSEVELTLRETAWEEGVG